MEHLSTFGLSRDPFANEPRTEGFFGSPAHLDAERRLARAVRQSKGLVMLLGEPGSGKSLLVRRLLESLEEEMFEACMLVPIPDVSDGHWVIDRLCRQLGEESPESDPAALLAQVYDHLATVREDGRHTVVLLDECQVLADAGFLAGLRGLLNLEYEERRLLTLVLTGPPELGAAVSREPALSSRVEVRVEIQPMDGEASEAYLHHRIRAAEGNPAILESGAVDALVKLGAGNPRRLNDLADGALFEAHLDGRHAATGEDVARAAAELRLPGAAAPAEAGTQAVIQPDRSATLLAGASAAEGSSPELLTPAEDLFARLPENQANAAEEPAPDRGDAAQTTILAASSDEGLDDLSSLLSDPAPAEAEPRRAGAPDATVALLDEAAVTAEPTGDPVEATAAAPVAAAAPVPGPATGAAETVALFAEPVEADGALDDLFADLVTEE
ncbi:MAG: AAA family ATPase [Myxococcota bacterium]|nr:AAA family ATPase [Myxococcota bacterium]